MRRDPRTNYCLDGEKPLRGIRIALIYPPYGPVKNEPGIKVVKENYGVFPNLSLLYAAGTLENAGCEVMFIDAQAEGLSLDQTVARLEKFRPDFTAYTITTYLFYQTLRWIEAIKARCPAPVVVGGVHMGIYPLETMSHRAIDYAVTGEAEQSLVPLIQGIVDHTPLHPITGIAFRDEARGGEVVVTPHAPSLQDVDSAPFPARHLLDNRLYYSFISQYKNFSALITSRGCPYKCIFCEQGAKQFRGRSANNVVDEIEVGVKEFGIQEYDVFDSSFTINRHRVHAICEEILRRKLKIYWSARTRADCVDKDMLRMMAKAGCMRIYYGIESGNEAILRTLLKESDLDQIKGAIRDTRAVGINTFGYFMVGNPGETKESVEQTIRFAQELELDFAQFSKVTPMPATELYTLFLQETGRDFWRDYILDEHVDQAIPRPGCSLSETEVLELTREAYLRFYYRPSYMVRALLRIKSGEELKRSLHTAWEMLAGKAA